jgi:hypothetical protein
VDARFAATPLKISPENLFLHCISQLDEATYRRLRPIEPALGWTLQREGDWITILKAEFELPARFEAQVRALWKRT